MESKSEGETPQSLIADLRMIKGKLSSQKVMNSASKSVAE
jgi:hypothetical protein